MVRKSLIALVLAGCTRGGGVDTDDTEVPGETDTEVPVAEACPDDSLLTWETFGRGHLTTWCVPCHGSQVPVEERSGAPLGVDFDTLEGVRQFAAAIADSATGEAPRMPPAGGVTPEAMEQLAEWLSCGAPGEPEPPGRCANLSWRSGDVTVASQAEADALCADANAVEGRLQLEADVVIDCLCEVGGAVEVGPAVTAVELPGLLRVGSLRIEDHGGLSRLVLPDLGAVAADLGLVRLGELLTVDLMGLIMVGGGLEVRELPALGELDLERLSRVEGDLLVVSNPGLVRLRLHRVGSVGGGLELRDNDALAALEDLASLREVGGDLVINDHALLAEVDGLDELLSVAGRVQVLRNEALVELRGFLKVREVEGLWVADNPVLYGINGFGQLETVRSGLVIENNARLDRIHDFGALRVVGLEGDSLVEDHQLRLSYNPALATVTAFERLQHVGAFVLDHNDRLPGLGRELGELTTIERELVIVGNDLLTSVEELNAVRSVGSDVLIINNFQLRTLQAEALVDRIGRDNIGGEVRIEGNRP